MSSEIHEELIDKIKSLYDDNKETIKNIIDLESLVQQHNIFYVRKNDTLIFFTSGNDGSNDIIGFSVKINNTIEIEDIYFTNS